MIVYPYATSNNDSFPITHIPLYKCLLQITHGVLRETLTYEYHTS